MSENIKIKLTIAERVYPLTISSDQEASLRISAKKIDDMTKQLEQNYAVRDKQDVLAMCALQYAAQLENQLNKNTIGDVSVKTNELIELIDLHLQLLSSLNKIQSACIGDFLINSTSFNLREVSYDCKSMLP